MGSACLASGPGEVPALFRRITIVTGAAIFGVVAGCGAAAAPSSGTATSASPSAGGTATDAGPTPLAGLPTALVGSWETDLRDHLPDEEIDFQLGPTVRMIIRAEGRAVLQRPFSQASFDLGIGGDHITFERILRAGELPCGVGVYRWEQVGDTLTFTAVEFDPCERRREVLEGIPYTRSD
jgi:hypothetical protein